MWTLGHSERDSEWHFAEPVLALHPKAFPALTLLGRVNDILHTKCAIKALIILTHVSKAGSRAGTQKEKNGPQAV